MRKGRPRAAIYIRFSGEEDRERQERELDRAARDIGFNEVESFKDQSGLDSRQAQDELLSQIQAGNFGALLVWKLDRLDLHSRSAQDLLSFVATLAERGVRFISLSDGIDSHASADRFAVAALKAVSEARMTIKGERVSRALKLAHASGAPVGRPKQRDDDAIEALRKKGLSLREIAAKTGYSPWAVQRSLRRRDKGPDSSV